VPTIGDFTTASSISASTASAAVGEASPPAAAAGAASAAPAAAAAPVQAAAPAAAPAEETTAEGLPLGSHIITSPIVGTFYRSSEPSAAPFVDIGDRVKKDQVLCIIEAMKLMNEITSEYEGEIVSAYVENGKPVQYGERLFAIKTT